ncbi:hypothetical protein Pint_35317 [Pistacia integerrima]|uniref:Uncharacterized protein n=1 Tax=Pistacia integerrima TaxID=434235 RepID=A0ACC0Y3D0_9ROSI|nr:hypothetical protein Pint_35317 [Pistacia integerrima]
MSNMSESPAEPQSGLATTIVAKEGDDVSKGIDVKVLEANHEMKTDSGGNGGDMFDGSGGNGKFNSGGAVEVVVVVDVIYVLV